MRVQRDFSEEVVQRLEVVDPDLLMRALDALEDGLLPLASDFRPEFLAEVEESRKSVTAGNYVECKNKEEQTTLFDKWINE